MTADVGVTIEKRHQPIKGQYYLMLVSTPGLPFTPHSVSPKLTTPTSVLRPPLEVTRPPKRTKLIECTLVQQPLTAAVSGAGVRHADSGVTETSLGADLVTKNIPILRRLAQPRVNYLKQSQWV